MSDWQPLLELVGSGPRENGTEALREATLAFAETLRAAGLNPEILSYLAHPLRLRLAGVLVLIGSLLYSLLLARGRRAVALLIAITLPVLVLADLDFYIPLFSWIGATPAEHIEIRLSVPEATRHLLLVAHLDSKTDLLDHVQRAPIEILAVPVSLLMIGVAAFGNRRPWLRKAALWLAPLYGIGTFLSLTGGAFVSQRSHGALDDGTACALLARLGGKLRAAPLEQTDVTLLFVSGEEVGVHGSWVYADSRFATKPAIPTAVLNFEFIGAAPDFGVFGKEAFSTSRYPADPALLAIADRVHLRQRGKPIYVTWFGAATDARSFLAHGIPALTVFSDPPGHPLPRELHSAEDTLSRVDPSSMDSALAYVEALVREIDSSGF